MQLAFKIITHLIVNISVNFFNKLMKTCKQSYGCHRHLQLYLNHIYKGSYLILFIYIYFLLVFTIIKFIFIKLQIFIFNLTLLVYIF